MKNFKDNQKVRHPKYGEGVMFIDRWETTYVVTFNDVIRAASSIGDDFYNELEEVEDLTEVGEYAYFYNDTDIIALYGKYNGNSNDIIYPYKVEGTLINFKNISKTPPFQ